MREVSSGLSAKRSMEDVRWRNGRMNRARRVIYHQRQAKDTAGECEHVLLQQAHRKDNVDMLGVPHLTDPDDPHGAVTAIGQGLETVHDRRPRGDLRHVDDEFHL